MYFIIFYYRALSEFFRDLAIRSYTGLGSRKGKKQGFVFRVYNIQEFSWYG